MIKKAASCFDFSYDVEIEETHHRLKKDAPSGTAYEMVTAVEEGRGKKMPLNTGHRQQIRSRGEIGLVSKRGGNGFGDHTIHFMGDDETISLNHQVSSRKVFASGTLKAALWLVTKKPGSLYRMEDVLSL